MSSILLVDDEVDILIVLEHVLHSAGHQVHTASTAAVALSLLNRPHRYDLVLADGKLPDGTGMMVADRAAEKGTRALIITGHAGQFQRDDLLRYPYLLKPIRGRELLREIERVLDRTSPITHEEYC